MTSPVSQLDQEIRWSYLLWALNANGQSLQDCSGVGYHEIMMYSPASQKMYKLIMGEAKSRRRIYPALMASSHNRGSLLETKFRQLESETRSSARRDALRRSLDLMRILEAFHSAEEEKITLRQLVLTRQGPGEFVVSYIDRWLEIA